MKPLDLWCEFWYNSLIKSNCGNKKTNNMKMTPKTRQGSSQHHDRLNSGKWRWPSWMNSTKLPPQRTTPSKGHPCWPWAVSQFTSPSSRPMARTIILAWMPVATGKVYTYKETVVAVDWSFLQQIPLGQQVKGNLLSFHRIKIRFCLFCRWLNLLVSIILAPGEEVLGTMLLLLLVRIIKNKTTHPINLLTCYRNLL